MHTWVGNLYLLTHDTHTQIIPERKRHGRQCATAADADNVFLFSLRLFVYFPGFTHDLVGFFFRTYYTVESITHSTAMSAECFYFCARTK